MVGWYFAWTRFVLLNEGDNEIDRFKHINNATRNVLEKCGFVSEEHSKKKKK